MFKPESEMSPDERRKAAKERQRTRQQQLEAMAKLAGWESWSQFVTALKNGQVEFPRKPQSKSD